MATVLGLDTETQEKIALDEDARSRGVYVIGSTGTGKTTLLESIAYQDMRSGDGLCVLDPHGDMIERILRRVPKERVKDTIYFDPNDLEFPFGINLLECDRDDPAQVRRVVDHFVSALARMFSFSWGPRLEHVLTHTLWTAMNIPGSTILEVLLLLTHKPYREKHTENLQEPVLKVFWDSYPKEKTRALFELIGSTVNKLTPFLLDRQMRNIVGQSSSTLEMNSIMDEKKILLVNLSKGKLGENNSSLLGSFLINMILLAAMSRHGMPEDERKKRRFHVIVDEYQNFASESFSTLQSEARKYAVDLVVAHQFRDQLSEENRGSALNVGNFVAFRTTGVDGLELASQFDNTPPEPDPVWEPIRVASDEYEGYFRRGTVDKLVPGHSRLYSDVMMQTGNDLANLWLFRGKAKILGRDDENARPVLREYVLDTLDPGIKENEQFFGTSNDDVAQEIRDQSRRMARAKEEVELEITKRTQGAADENLRPVASAQVVED